MPYLESLPGDTPGTLGPVTWRGAVVGADAVDLLDGGHSEGRPGAEVARGRLQEQYLMYICLAMEAVRMKNQSSS